MIYKDSPILSQNPNQFYLINFNKANLDYADLGTTVINSTRTIQFWFKLASPHSSGTTVQVLLQRRNPSNNNNRVVIWLTADGKLTYQNTKGAWTGTYSTLTSNATSWSAGTWYHVAITIDSVLGSKMYVDGVQQTVTDAYANAIPVDTYSTILGKSVASSGRELTGAIKNLQFWTTARSLAEINIDKNEYYVGGTSGLKEAYPFIKTGANTIAGVNTTSGTLYTSNAGGNTYIENTMFELIT